MKAAIAQIAPVMLDRDRTLDKVVRSVLEAGKRGCGLVAFGEALVPGYPVWLCRTDAARFDAKDQKEIHARYADQAVTVEECHLAPVQEAARTGKISVVLGIIERPRDRGGHSLYCSRVFIGVDGAILSVHRKLVPTYEERLSWAPGDAAGLVTHRVGPFMAGALNCWENWMPLARAALQAQGMDLHVMLWPGAERNTRDITRFAALEGRSFVLSASSLIRSRDVPASFPHRARFVREEETWCDGGSAIAGPDGTWIIEPVTGVEDLLVADLDPVRIREERQNFDPPGHYARPEILRVSVNRRRSAVLEDL